MTDSAWPAALRDSSGTAVVGVDVDGRTTFWSPGAQALFGWTAEEVMGRAPPIVPPTLLQEWHLQMRRVLETGEPSAAAEAQRVTKDGRTVWVVRSSSPVRDNIGQTIGLLDTLMDVTLLRQLDEESRALAQARERELIAMDLHDGLIQSLYALVLNLGAQERVLTTTPADALQALKNGRGEVERVIEEARTYVLNLRSRQFTPRDLAAGLKLLADGLRLNAGIEVRVSVDPSAQTVLQPEVRGHVLYLVREAVSNVLRHAEASEVEISLRVATGAVVVHVVDNGRGFEPPRVTRERQHGLHTMAERARLIGGQLTVDSRPGGGTRVCLELPLASAEC